MTPIDPYIVSARKYRPSTFASVVGQKALTATLKNAVATRRLAHSYLFCGSRGVGKTSCARIFAKTINCSSPTPDGEACNECESCRAFNEGTSLNIFELDAASNNSVDNIRQLVDQVQVPPSMGAYRVFIVDEVHMLSSAAFNAFLKTLEEPPSYVVFILATTEKHKIIPTILSRCQIYDFARITVRDMVDHLAYVASQEGITADPAALAVIARKADGAMRDALSIFDQVAASSRGNITYQSTIDNLNVLDQAYYGRLLDCFLEGRVLDSWLIYKEVRDRGFDSHFFLVGIADYMRDLMVARDPRTACLLEADDEARAAMAATAQKCSPEFIYRAMNLCNEADLNYRTASNKQFLVELTLARLCQLSSPSPTDSAAGEGPLQKIQAQPSAPSHSPSSPTAPAPVQAAAPAPVSTPAPAAPKPQPPAAPASPAPPRQAQPQAAPPAQRRTVLRSTGQTLSINPASPTLSGQSVASEPAATLLREAKYDDEKLHAAWQAYIDAHPTEHILVNTMRASNPERQGGDAYRITVENEMQSSVVAQAMPEILSFVRDALANDHFTLAVEINQGASSPHTWSEREVLAHIVETVPAMRDFIDDLQLTL